MRKISVPEDGIETLFGSYDENLRQLETAFGVRIRTQGSDLLVEGAPDDEVRVERTVSQLSSLRRPPTPDFQGSAWGEALHPTAC